MPELDPLEAHRKTRFDPKTALLVVLGLLATLGFLGWRASRTSRLRIPAVTRDSEQRLLSPSGNPSSLRVRVRGWIDGRATIRLDEREAVRIGPGPVDWTGGVDCLQPACLLRYSPATVTQGELSVEYRFDK